MNTRNIIYSKKGLECVLLVNQRQPKHKTTEKNCQVLKEKNIITQFNINQKRKSNKYFQAND